MIIQNIEPVKNNNPTPHKIQEDRQWKRVEGRDRYMT